MTEKISDVIKAVVDNYHTGFAQWNPNKIRDSLPSDLAERLDFGNSDSLLRTLKEAFPDEPITPYIVEHKFPVWVDPDDPIPTPDSDYLVIVVMPEDDLAFIARTIPSIHNYARKCNADFILLRERTQGSLFNEKFRVKPFVERYKRTIVLSPNLLIKEECPNLFELVPENSVGVYDDSVTYFEKNPNLDDMLRRKRALMLSKRFSVIPLISPEDISVIEYLSNSMPTLYSNDVVVCSKQHSEIWNPINFLIKDDDLAGQLWTELNIYENDYSVYLLPNDFNCSSWDESLIFRFPRLSSGHKIKSDWASCSSLELPSYEDDGIVLDQSLFKILCLGHSQQQFDSIKDRTYLEKVNLNDLNTELDNRWAESRIYDIDFDTLFPQDKKFAGLVTASWNKKYFGFNPIDQFHNWDGAKYLASCDNKNVILCGSVDSPELFTKPYWGMRTLLNLTDSEIEYLLNLVGLGKTSELTVPVANQIIAYRETVKSLFDFYKNNNIIEKIQYFLNKISPVPTSELNARRTPAYLSEFITTFWMASQNFLVLPQEVTRSDWNLPHLRIQRQY